ncbi:MAG TPA: magnesium transporter CorA family protein [Solirubrobacteraceae bacterium]|nr:magnesium transporter CorA family protein [Solirubrobacteraceae bacterium]
MSTLDDTTSPRAAGQPHPSVCRVHETTATARTRLYRGGALVAEGFPVAEISNHLEDDDAIVWLDLSAACEADLRRISEEFSLDPLAIEDATAARERPKLDRYPDHLFLNLYAGYVDRQTMELQTSEVAAFVTRRALITVRKDDHFDADELTAVWDGNVDLARSGVGFLLHGLLDLVVDSHFAAVQVLDDELEALEDHLFDEKPSGGIDVPRRSFELRKSLVRLRRVVLPMRELVNTLMRRHLGVVDDSMAPYYQDVYDHVLRATEWTDGLRDFVTTILETHLTIQGNRLNETMKKLTSWAAIIAVPTAVTGFFGQNVPYPGFQQQAGFYGSLGLMLLIGIVLYVSFRRRGWL